MGVRYGAQHERFVDLPQGGKTWVARGLRAALLPVAALLVRLRSGRLREPVVDRALYRLVGVAERDPVAEERRSGRAEERMGHHLPALVQAVATRLSSLEFVPIFVEACRHVWQVAAPLGALAPRSSR